MNYICEFTQEELDRFNAILDELPLKYARPLIQVFDKKFKQQTDEKTNNPVADSSNDSMQVLQGESTANDKA